ncbi:MAG: hypothetical protein IJD95_00235 [Clostridia bacterium]|nr:hypothetical protein [Clostridia bacterium]
MKKKIFSVLLAVVMILPITSMLFPVDGVAANVLPQGWYHSQSGGASINNFHLRNDGSVAMSWGNPSVNWAHLTLAYDASRYNNNYTVTVDVRVPESSLGTTTDANGNPVVVDNTGAPVVGVKGTFEYNGDDGYSDSWHNSAGVVLLNAKNIASEAYYKEWGYTYNLCLPMDGYESINNIGLVAHLSHGALNIKAGEYNTVKIKVEGNKVSAWVNGMFAWVKENVTASGQYVVLGSRGDCGVIDNSPAFKNFKIESNDGSVATYTAFTDLGWMQFLPSGKHNGAALAVGNVAVNADNSISMTGVGYFGSAGIYSNNKIDIDLAHNNQIYYCTLHLSINNSTGYDQGAGAIIYLSKEKFDGSFCSEDKGNTVENNVLNNYGYSAICNTDVTAAYVINPNANRTINVHGGTSSVLCDVGRGYTAAETLNADYTNFTVTFTADANYVYFYVNGVLDPDYTVPRSRVLDSDGRCYIGISSTGYGSAVQTVTLKSIQQVSNIPAALYQDCDSGWQAHITTGNSVPGKIVYNNNNTITLDATTHTKGEVFSYAGITSHDKLTPQEATVVFSAENFAHGPNTLFGILLSNQKPTHNTDQSTLVGNRTFHPNVGGVQNGLVIALHKTEANSTTYNAFINGITPNLNYNRPTQAPVNGKTTVAFSVPYVKNGRTYLKIYINGAAIQDINPANNNELIDIEYDITGLLDANGQVYLSLFAVGEQNYQKMKATIYSVDGVSPNCTHAKSAPEINGAQYRTNSAYGDGIRFKTTIEHSIFNGGQNLLNVVDYGTLIMPVDKVGYSYNLQHTADGKINGIAYVDIKGKLTWYQEPQFREFTAVLIDIPEIYSGGSNDKREFVAVSYIKFVDGTIVYSRPCTRSINYLTSVSG